MNIKQFFIDRKEKRRLGKYKDLHLFVCKDNWVSFGETVIEKNVREIKHWTKERHYTYKYWVYENLDGEIYVYMRKSFISLREAKLRKFDSIEKYNESYGPKPALSFEEYSTQKKHRFY